MQLGGNTDKNLVQAYMIAKLKPRFPNAVIFPMLPNAKHERLLEAGKIPRDEEEEYTKSEVVISDNVGDVGDRIRATETILETLREVFGDKVGACQEVMKGQHNNFDV